MTWRKVPNFPKWAGYDGGKHCASFVIADDGIVTAWVNAGRGFQQLLGPREPTDVKGWKRRCEVALTQLRQVSE